MPPNRILFIGPVTPPVTGQAVAFTKLVGAIRRNHDYVIDINFEAMPTFKKVFRTIWTLLAFTVISLKARPSTVYITLTRSKGGALKDIFILLASRALAAKVIAHLHGADLNLLYEKSTSLYRKILVASHSRIAVGIVLTEGMKKQFRNFGSIPVQVIPNFYDPIIEDMCSERPSSSVVDPTVKFIYLSNIIEEKGILVLLDSFEKCLRHGANIHLTIVGPFLSSDSSSDFRTLVEKRIGEIGSVNYLGPLFGEDKFSVLMDSDVFVLPTFYKAEAFPLAIVDAMACGNAVISTYHNYIPEVVEESFGLLVKPNDSEELSEAMLKLASDRELLRTMKQNSELRAKNFYSFSSHCERVLSVIHGDYSLTQ